ncbi:MAG: prephenate dehydrogenase dimerization domain-containing protein [Candidatus Kariarchaeaceae archaeon]|jgi:prephenate dehydrogenase
MLIIHTLELENHDNQMLYSLGLSDFINLLNRHILTKSEFNYKDLERFAPTTFKKQIVTTQEVFSENPQLYFSIQQINAFQNELYEEIKKGTEELIEIISSNDKLNFIKIMENGNQFLGGGVFN